MESQASKSAELCSEAMHNLKQKAEQLTEVTEQQKMTLAQLEIAECNLELLKAEQKKAQRAMHTAESKVSGLSQQMQMVSQHHS